MRKSQQDHQNLSPVPGHPLLVLDFPLGHILPFLDLSHKKAPGAWRYSHASCPAPPHSHKLPQASQGADVRRQGSQFVVADNEHPQGQLADIGWQR